MNQTDDDLPVASDRRVLVKRALAGGSVAGLMLPHSWIKPVIETVIVPAHAATSTAVTTTTIAPTTTVTAATTTITPTTTPVPTTSSVPTTTPAPTSTNGTVSLSDRRMKRDVSRVGVLPSGLQLYRFSYLDSDAQYVGVMAQEVIDTHPAAVKIGHDGYMRVDYSAIGFKMMTVAEWEGSQDLRQVA